MCPKAKLQNASTLPEMEAAVTFVVYTVGKYKFTKCKQSADTEVLIGRFQLSTKWPIVGRLSEHL